MRTNAEKSKNTGRKARGHGDEEGRRKVEMRTNAQKVIKRGGKLRAIEDLVGTASK